jgi:hypothetical protein
MFMLRLRLLALPTVGLALLLASCAPTEGPLPTEWPDLEAVDGVLDVGVTERVPGLPPTVHVQLDERAEPADIARAAVEVRDTATELAPLADGFDLLVTLVRPGDYPAGSALWTEGTQFEPDFEPIMATFAAFGVPEPATKVAVHVFALDGEHYDEWRIECFVQPDLPSQRLLRDTLMAVATEQGLEIWNAYVDGGIPGS